MAICTSAYGHMYNNVWPYAEQRMAICNSIACHAVLRMAIRKSSVWPYVKQRMAIRRNIVFFTYGHTQKRHMAIRKIAYGHTQKNTQKTTVFTYGHTQKQRMAIRKSAYGHTQQIAYGGSVWVLIVWPYVKQRMAIRTQFAYGHTQNARHTQKPRMAISYGGKSPVVMRLVREKKPGWA